MNRQRALELCDEAENTPSPQRALIMIQAIRELAKDDLKPVTTSLREEIRSLIIWAYRNEIEADIVTDRIMIRISPLQPLSDPTSLA